METFKFPDFWLYSAWLDILSKYRRTRLGIIWSILPTAIFVIVLGTVYGRLMGSEPASYLPFLCIGYMSWRFLTHVLSDSAGVFRGHQAYILQGRVRLTDYLMKVFVKALFYFFMTVPVLVGIFFWSEEVSVVNLISMFYTLPALMLAIIIIGGHLAFLAARFPDVPEFVNTLLIFGFLLTPILWRPSQAPGGRIIHFLVKANPAYNLLEFVRGPALGVGVDSSVLLYVFIFIFTGLMSLSVIYNKYASRVPFWN